MRYRIKLFKWCVKDIFLFIFFNGPWYEVEDDMRRLLRIKAKRDAEEEMRFLNEVSKIR